MMIEKSNALYVKLFNGSFQDISHKMNNFERDVVSTDLNTDGFIYIGFRKPIHSVYINLKNFYETESQINGEFYNGTSWEQLANVSDDTFGLKRAGFISWDIEPTQKSNAIDGTTGFWYRFSVANDRSGLTLSGINLIFCDDYELEIEFPYINSNEFLGTKTSHVLSHVASRNEIIQFLRSKNYYKINPTNGNKEDLNQWDLLLIDEVKEAAKYLAISKILYSMSDSPNDTWANKSSFYRERYQQTIQKVSLSFDANDNGVLESGESKKATVNSYYMSR